MLDRFSKPPRDRSATYESFARSAHPLARRVARRRAARRQLALSCALLVAALAAGAFAGRAALPLIIGSAAASCLFALLLAITTGAVREAVVDAVARGELRVANTLAPAPLSRLLSPSNRRTLAGTLALCLQPESRRGSDVFSVPRAHLRRNPGLRLELERVIERLLGHDASPAGVALTHQLVTEVGSPLYGASADELRDSLGRLGYRLAEGAPRSG
jgi:hypothetical protein